MKNIMLGILIKILFASNSFAQTAYYSYSAYYNIHKVLKKTYIKPVKGYIFRKKYYKGIFIRPTYRAKYIKAANSGKIIFSGFLKYYGNVIIIKHKGNYKTIYAHLKRNFVKKGQYVKKGQIIGSIYRNKAIYFEVRKNIKPVNVYAFLR